MNLRVCMYPIEINNAYLKQEFGAGAQIMPKQLTIILHMYAAVGVIGYGWYLWEIWYIEMFECVHW